MRGHVSIPILPLWALIAVLFSLRSHQRPCRAVLGNQHGDPSGLELTFIQSDSVALSPHAYRPFSVAGILAEIFQ